MNLYVIALILFSLVTCSVLKKCKTSTIKGRMGENKIANLLKTLPKDEYVVLNNIMVPYPGGTSQIDHVVVSIHGIFIIETKNYSGTLYGNENDVQLEHVVNGNTYKIYNPLKQNIGHTYTLSRVLNLRNRSAFKPITVLLNSCHSCVWTSQPIVYQNELLNQIKQEYGIVFTKNEVLKYAEMLRNANITNKQMRKEHNKIVAKKIAFQQ